MTKRTRIGLILGSVALFAPHAAPPARALLNIDGTRNQIFVFGSVGYSYDSNIFSDATASGDYTTNAKLGVELKRKRGIITVDATASVDYMGFDRFKDQDSWNPSFSAELAKTTGRTTGTLSVNAYRTNRADSAVNLRTSSWNYPVALNIKYPVNDHLYLTSSTGYMRRRFAQDPGTALANYYDISQGIDAYYTYSSKLDLVAGYRVRRSDTAVEGLTYDHAVSFGVTGGLLPKLNGSLRAGYQLRDIVGRNERYGQATLAASLRWVATRKFSLTLQAARDFSTTAVGSTVDSTSGSADATYSFSRKLEFSAGLGGGRNRFVGPTALSREDMFFTWNAGARYTYNEHFVIGGTYSYMKNWSTFEFSDFERTSYTIDVSSRF